MDSRAAGARQKVAPRPRETRRGGKGPAPRSRTRPPRTQRRGAPREPQLAPLYLPTERCAGGRGHRAEDREHPAGTPAPGRARLWGAPAGAGRGEETSVQGGRPSARRRAGTPRGVPPGRERRSPLLPKVRTPAPRARSPWSRRPARDRRRSRAAGLRRVWAAGSPLLRRRLRGRTTGRRR